MLMLNPIRPDVWDLWVTQISGPIKVLLRICLTCQNFEKPKIYKGKSAANVFGGPPEIIRGT
jgi:hypothetical protein